MSVMKSHIQECQKELLCRWWSLCFFSLKSLWNYNCYSIPSVVCMLPQQKDSFSGDFPKNGLLNAWQFKNVTGSSFLAWPVVILPHVRLFPKPSWGHVLEENGSFSKVSSSCLMHVSISPSACVIGIHNARASNLLDPMHGGQNCSRFSIMSERNALLCIRWPLHTYSSLSHPSTRIIAKSLGLFLVFLQIVFKIENKNSFLEFLKN